MKGKERTTNSGLCHTIVFILIIVIIKILVILSFYVFFFRFQLVVLENVEI